MGKTDAKGRNKKDARHVRHYEVTLASPAYRALSCYGRALLTELKRLYNGDNNGRLYLSLRAAAEAINANKDTAGKAFSELRAKGFIRPNQIGAYSQKVSPDGSMRATTWILSEFAFGDELASKEYMRWRSAADDVLEPPTKTKRGAIRQTDCPATQTNCLPDRQVSARSDDKTPNCLPDRTEEPETCLPDRTHVVTR